MEENGMKRRIAQLQQELQIHQNRLNQAQQIMQIEQRNIIAKLAVIDELQNKRWENAKDKDDSKNKRKGIPSDV